MANKFYKIAKRELANTSSDTLSREEWNDFWGTNRDEQDDLYTLVARLEANEHNEENAMKKNDYNESLTDYELISHMDA